MTNTDFQRSCLGMTWDDINRLQGRKRQQAMAIWQWAAPRFSSLGTEQDRYFQRYGAERTYQRINRIRAWLGLEILQ